LAIQKGDRVPSGTFDIMTTDGPGKLKSDELFAGRKVVLFSLPGAFTPTCSKGHLPGFVRLADDIRREGVDEIACLAVNDVWVMNAWGKDQGVGDRILMLADGNATYSEALGLTFDGSAGGMGVRGQRFAMIVDDGIVTFLAIEAPRKFEVSSAEAILAALS